MKKPYSVFAIAILICTIFLSACGNSTSSSSTPSSSSSASAGETTFFQNIFESFLDHASSVSSSHPENSETQAESQSSASSSDAPQSSSSSASGHSHNYSTSVTQPTCTTGGYTTYTCSCGHAYTGNETAPLGHSFSSWQVGAPATESAAGYEVRTCTRCGYQETKTIPQLVNTSTFSTQVIQLVNAERQKAGLSPLQADSWLNSYALTRSKELPSNFNHVRPDGSDPLTPVMKHGYMSAGENIAYGYTTPEDVVTAWMNSPGHRKNILSPGFTHIGVGCYYGNSVFYWTQIFAR